MCFFFFTYFHFSLQIDSHSFFIWWHPLILTPLSLNTIPNPSLPGCATSSVVLFSTPSRTSPPPTSPLWCWAHCGRWTTQRTRCWSAPGWRRPCPRCPWCCCPCTLTGTWCPAAPPASGRPSFAPSARTTSWPGCPPHPTSTCPWRWDRT